jgi:hypothetical protein
MRLGTFESKGMEPLGQGDERKVFINPTNEKKVISERKEGAEVETPRQLKGSYYLTKIVHALLPENVPDIYQVGEAINGKQFIDAERIAHTPGQALLQEARRAGRDEEEARDQLLQEVTSREMNDLDLKLERIGLGFNIDSNIGNYTRDEAGNVHYLETFRPWQADIPTPEGLEALFDEEALRTAIDELADPKIKEKCHQYLARLLVLMEEEKASLA